MYCPGPIFIAARLARSGCPAPHIESVLIVDFGFEVEEARCLAIDAVFEHGFLVSRFSSY